VIVTRFSIPLVKREKTTETFLWLPVIPLSWAFAYMTDVAGRKEATNDSRGT